MRSFRWMILIFVTVNFSGCIDNGPTYDADAIMAADIEAIDNYIAKNNIQNVIKDISGVRFSIEKIGTGGFPAKTNQTVRIAYKGSLMNGTVFDQNDNYSALVSDLIPGWQYVMTVWPAGTKGKAFIPSPLGYRNQGYGSVPPDAILLFDIELKQVIPSNADKARLAADVVKVDEFLSSNSIDAVKDSTGVRYVITNPGTGYLPSWYTKVKFSYTGKVIPGGSQVFNGSSEPTETFDSRVVDFLHGMQVGLTKIGKGGKITLYIPSGLAYGTEVNNTPVTANSNLQVDLEIQDIF